MQFQDSIVDNPYKCHFDRLVPVYNVWRADECIKVFARVQELEKDESWQMQTVDSYSKHQTSLFIS